MSSNLLHLSTHSGTADDGMRMPPGVSPDELQEPSPLLGSLALLVGRWVVPVLHQVTTEGKRHRELLDANPGISASALTVTLQRMQRDGLLARDGGAGMSRHTVYVATPLARSLDEPVRALLAWHDAHWAEVKASRLRWDRQ
jgi:DNA-binding HxlR family transcriptional regulator